MVTLCSCMQNINVVFFTVDSVAYYYCRIHSAWSERDGNLTRPSKRNYGFKGLFPSQKCGHTVHSLGSLYHISISLPEENSITWLGVSERLCGAKDCDQVEIGRSLVWPLVCLWHTVSQNCHVVVLSSVVPEALVLR